MANISASGMGSGLDINGLVTQLVDAERTPQKLLLDKAEATAQAKISALGTVKSVYADFRTALTKLSVASGFNAKIATSSDPSVFTINATNSAAPGTFNLVVNDLAQSQKLRSGVFSLPTSTVGSGTLLIQFGTYNSGGNTFTLNGSKPAQSIAIPSSSNSLQGIRDTINNANAGVTASIVTDTSGSRLVLTSQDSGLANSIRVLVTDADGNNTDNSGLSALAYDPTAAVGSGKNLTESLPAKDAAIVLDGVSISSPSNTLTTAIEGTTITLLKADPNINKTVLVAANPTGVKSAVNDFIKNYNAIVDKVGPLASFDQVSKKGGILLGDATLSGLQTEVGRILGRPVAGIVEGIRSLAELGITTGGDGKLTLDTSKLDKVLSTDINSVGRVFAAVGKPSDSLINFVDSTDSTKVGSYGINISQLATQGTVVGGQAANLTITAGVNDTLSLNVDGTSSTIVLTAGTYTAAGLAAELQTRVNGVAAYRSNNSSVNVTQSAGILTITSARFGSSSSVNITGGTAATSLLGTSTTTAGVDVAGTIGGITATGHGQFLTGVGNAAGLQIEVTGGATGDRGSISFTQGVAVQMSAVFKKYLDANGIIGSRTDGLNKEINTITDKRSDLESRLLTLQRSLLEKFTAMDSLVSNLKSTSSFLSTQLSSLSASLSGNKQ